MLEVFSLKNSEKIFKGVHLAMAVLFLLISVYIISYNTGSEISIAAFCAAYIVLALIRHFIIANVKENILHWIFPYLEGAALFVINRLDSGSTGLALYMVLTLDVAFDYCYAYGVVFTLTAYVIYMVDYVKLVPPMSSLQKILLLGIAAFQFFIYMGFAFLARRFSTQSRKLQKTSAELHSRLITLEEMTLLKERNRIAGDIHNTVGHQLTTALVQVEAARMLMDKDPQEVVKRLDIIKDQVRTGLSELRKSVHAINAGDEYEDLEGSAKKLFEQVKNHAGVGVEYRLDDTGGVRLKVKRLLYNVMLEAVTNAIRHGNCSMIKMHLEVNDGIATLSVFNDGIIPRDVKFGFGLGQMEKNLEKTGGRLNIKVNEDGWFGLIAQVPVQNPEGESDD